MAFTKLNKHFLVTKDFGGTRVFIIVYPRPRSFSDKNSYEILTLASALCQNFLPLFWVMCKAILIEGSADS